jgi:hypothetical protein
VEHVTLGRLNLQVTSVQPEEGGCAQLDPVKLGYPDGYRVASLVVGRERRVLVVTDTEGNLVRYSDARFGKNWYNIEVQFDRGSAFARTAGRASRTSPGIAMASDELGRPQRTAELVLGACRQQS